LEEAFSDGVIATLVTIMVLERKVPHGDDWGALRPLVPVFSYVLSFVYLGIYWNNHHHMLHAVETNAVIGNIGGPNQLTGEASCELVDDAGGSRHKSLRFAGGGCSHVPVK
jgi:hypothetical protein